MPSPTVLQIVPSLDRSGMARATLDAAQAVIAAGGSAIVASPGGDLVPDLLRLRARHVDLPGASHPVVSRLALPARLASSLGESGIDVVQARSPEASWIARAVARRLEVKWIATLHRPLLGDGLLSRYIEHRQAAADVLVAVSDHVARDARQRLRGVADRLEVIPPGVNLERFNPAVVRADRVIRLAGELRIPDGSHVILCPARFDEDRGQKLLIDAVKRLGRADVFCLLLGSIDPPTTFERELERAIESAGLQGLVQIGAHVEDMPAAYMLADVVVTTGGAREGYARALIEAQAMGRPVVAADDGGAAEALLPGTTGWVAAGDSEALAAALTAALSLTLERRSELARIAQDHVRDRYGLAHSNQRLLDLFDRLA